ncbi:MAG: CCA tRNA nucleotidyltransferase [Pseudomonadota bacterium]
MTQLDEAWLQAPETLAVMRALDGEAYFVGGCVRNSLLGQPVADIDLSTPLVPEAVARCAETAGLKAIPTGIDHGTITIVAGESAFEVTTFRRDVETDGRRAVVAFSTDMTEDAVRRDFTMNALYANAEGWVIDPLGGLPDLQAHRVKFILDPEARIREDALRILRFFRFTAWYGDEFEPEGLAACAALAELVDGLARERVGAEMRKLLAAKDPATAISAMAESGVLRRILPGALADPLAPLVACEHEAGIAPDPMTRLAALGGESDLRLSKAEQHRLADIQHIVAEQIAPARAAVDYGPDLATAGYLILSALLPMPWRDVSSEIAFGAQAVFPVSAQDLIAIGCVEGPEIGNYLTRAREAWIESGFTLSKAALLHDLQSS